MKNLTKIFGFALTVIAVFSIVCVCAFSASAKSLKKPTKVKVINQERAIKISWKKVSKAKKYKIFRNSKVIKTTKKTSYNDYGVSAGKTYSYKIKPYSGKITGKASKAVKLTRINPTVIKNISNGDKSITLNWSKKTGADKYVIYRKSSDSDTFVKIKSVITLYFSDTDVTSGTKYTYKILCYKKSTKSYSKESSKVSTVYLDKVTGVFARENTDSKSITVKWNRVTGADSYIIYKRKAAESSYEVLAVTSSTIYIDFKTSVNPTAYRYKIVATKDKYLSVDSSAPLTFFTPLREDTNPYYYDENDNFHIPITLNKGETYAELKALSDFLSLDGLYTATVTSGNDIISVNDSIITAENSGKACVEIKSSDESSDIVSLAGSAALNNIYNKHCAKSIFLDVEVA